MSITGARYPGNPDSIPPHLRDGTITFNPPGLFLDPLQFYPAFRVCQALLEDIIEVNAEINDPVSYVPLNI